jgi:hypothetical protein
MTILSENLVKSISYGEGMRIQVYSENSIMAILLRNGFSALEVPLRWQAAGNCQVSRLVLTRSEESKITFLIT